MSKQEIAVKDEKPSNTNALASVLPPSPDFMAEDGRMGTDLVTQKIQPPYLKIIQKQSGDELHSEFGIGAAILVPDNVLVLQPNAAPVRIVPIFFYSEFLKLTSIKLKGQEPMIAERSIDPGSDLARRCASKDLWYEAHPKHPGDDSYNYRNAEALSFLCMFQEEHLRTGFPFVLSFMKGSYGKGRLFCNQISMRKKPIFGCVFNLSVDPKLASNASGEWRRFLTGNPVDHPWVEDPAEYAEYKAMHSLFYDHHTANRIVTNYDEDDVVDVQTPASTETGGY